MFESYTLFFIFQYTDTKNPIEESTSLNHDETVTVEISENIPPFITFFTLQNNWLICIGNVLRQDISLDVS